MRVTHLLDIDTVVYRPHGLEVIAHAMFEVSREVVDAEEILEVFGLGVEGGAPGVHPLYDGGHITEYYSVHDS